MLAGVFAVVQLGVPRDARPLSCAAPAKSATPPPPAKVFSVSLSASATTLETPASVDLRGRYSYAVCSGPGPRVILEARVDEGEFAPARGVAVYWRGTPFICATNDQPPPLPAGACGTAWGTEDAIYVAAPAETTEFRLRAGPLVSDPVVVDVARPQPETRCEDTVADIARNPPVLQLVPDRQRIVYGESVQVRGRFGYELCGRLLRPNSAPAIESRWVGARYTNQPAEHVRSGPVATTDGEHLYVFAPPATTSYRLFYASTFGRFTTIQVEPRLELAAKPASDGMVTIHVQAQASHLLQGTPARFEKWTGSRWKTLRTVPLNGQLAATLRISASANTVEIRASVRASKHHTAAVSPRLLIRGAMPP